MRGSISFTPAGLGAGVLVMPGLLLGVVAKEPALISVVFGFSLLIIVNTVWSWWAVQRVSLAVTHSGYATVGTSTSLNVEVTEPAGADIQALVHPDSDRKWITAQVPASGTIKLSPSVRGVFTAVEAQVKSSFPLGLITIHRSVVISLEQPLHVAPRRSRINIPALDCNETMVPLGRIGSPVGIRDFVGGDLRRDIHWPLSAATGSLIVRDRRQIEQQPNVSVVVDLSSVEEGDIVAADQVLSWARSAIEKLLATGFDVSLQTLVAREKSTDSQVKVFEVKSQEQLIRGLALTMVGQLNECIDTTGGRVLRISQAGLLWQLPR